MGKKNGAAEASKRKTSAEALYTIDKNSPIRVQLDRESIEYYPGEEITGTVTLTASDKPIDLKQITINAFGIGRTSWAVPKENSKKQLNQANASTEPYIDETFNVTGDGNTVDTISGLREFPFKYTLPYISLPSTFIDAFGSVTYVLKVNAVTGSEELKCMCAFLINGLFDLNQEPELMQQAELYDHKAVGCCCMKWGTVEILVKLPHRGYVLGDRVSWKADITNKSTHKVKEVSARLLQKALFHADHENKEDTKRMAVVYAGSVAKQSTEKWEGYLEIPKDLPPTRLGGSKLIVITYAIEFELCVAGCTKNLRAEIPIGIGTTPLTMVSGVDKGDVAQFGKSSPSTA